MKSQDQESPELGQASRMSSEAEGAPMIEDEVASLLQDIEVKDDQEVTAISHRQVDGMVVQES